MKTQIESKMKIANRIAVKYENSDGYTIAFKDKLSVAKFYENVKKMCHTTNFNLDPFNNNAFGLLTLDGVDYIVDPPKHTNGDANWYSYKTINCFAIIR